jgi:hypothetical protein
VINSFYFISSKLRLTHFWHSTSLRDFFFQHYWLCMIPSFLIHKQLTFINDNSKPALHGIQEFGEYFTEKYVKGRLPKSFPVDFWNRYDENEFKVIDCKLLDQADLRKYVACEYPNIFKVSK